MKFTITPIGAARLFLQFADLHGDDAAQRLEGVILAFAVGAHNAAIEDAQKEYRKWHSGGCKMPSQQHCECFLCTMDDRKVTQ